MLYILFFFFIPPSYSQTYNPVLFNCMKWRMIGPYRGGRTVGSSGDLLHPNIFYIGVNNGGVWKTTDYGRTWNPVFDDQPTGSVGDVAVAPSNPNVIYVGTGEGLQRPDLSEGNGVYRSSDAGKTWTHLGLSEGLQIGGLSIDPKNENILFVAVLGHPYGPNKERGVFRTVDGGKSWEKVLFIDENTGAIQVTIDPIDSKIIYADLWAGRQAPWENGEWSGSGSGLFKSSDGGTTWKQLKNGLPSVKEGLNRIGFCIAPSNHNRLYALASADEKSGGLYRTDDGGESWKKINDDIRLWDRGDDFAELKVDPKNEDIIYDANVVVWKSLDGGKTFYGFKGAPGGDDYHRLWINPNNTDIILLSSDQGAAITVNGGNTWSSWYNQPTAQLYHVSADNAFPYNVYSGQQESGSVGIASRGNDGAITFRDWHPVAAEEYGYVIADPLDPNIIYGGKISKYDKRTGQAQDISPDILHSNKYRFLRTAPMIFSPIDKKTLFFAGNVLFKTHDAGNSWKVISPDLTRSTYDIPECIGVYKTDSMKMMPQRGVIYTIALSPLDSNVIWVGTDDGLMHITTDGGKNWKNITPPAVTTWSKVSILEASHTDVNTAYAAVNRIRLDDQKPHIYRTKDSGKTWIEIVKGLPNDPINVVKEDPQQKGLLFAGSETSVYVSFDDGDNWQPLRFNMPATSIRDLIIKDNDLVVATHGRSFWILDDITPLRQTVGSAAQNVIFYKPETAYRVRWNLNTDTPLPQEEPAGKNPPDGAIIDYYLAEKANTEVTMDISDEGGNIVRHFSSKDTMYKIPDVNIPLYWIRPQQILSAASGSHRFMWDMHYKPLNVPASYSISAIYGDTPPNPTSPWVMPGKYSVKLTVDGKIYSQAFEIKMDPRVKTSMADLQQQHDLSLQLYHDEEKTLEMIAKLNPVKEQLKNSKTASKESLSSINELLKKENALSESLNAIIGNLQGADVAPTSQCITSAKEANSQFEDFWKKMENLKAKIK
ncbi:MAG: WD40/YVTN/BNR-like repeat-containing protein [Bacteroidia bacterium]